ncbi:uncharacterized protein LOC109928160 isoform X2 [Rhincodon typus]|uniref:uncharacterized protein LOC109928160 isoform X2 n=1 Tax=Rhincodon typus TaxID=259920 RepID=UPI00202F8F55|nr:uncharacterized protein LOC109928160 isoform X2 [Rhincodon typus]
METLYKTKFMTSSEQMLQREASNHVTVHKRPKETLRITETKTCLKMSDPHLPKISCAVVQKNDVKRSEVPFSSIVDFFMERKKILQWNGLQWQRINISVPCNFPLVIRGYKNRNSGNMEDDEKCTGNRKGRKGCGLESSINRKFVQNAVEELTNTNKNCASSVDNDGYYSALQQYYGPLSTKCQKVGTKMADKFHVEHEDTVDDEIKSAKSRNSSSDSVANVKLSKGFVRKPGNNQHRFSVAYLSETGNTRVELEQICHLPGLNRISLDLEIEHRSVSQAANHAEGIGTDKLCIDNCARNVESTRSENEGGLDLVPRVQSKVVFPSPVQHIPFLTSTCEKPEGKMNKLTKHPDGNIQSTKSTSSIATSLSKASIKSCTGKISNGAICHSTISKCCDKESKVSEGDIKEEYISDFNHMFCEKARACTGSLLPVVESGMRSHNQKQPRKSVLKKSFDGRNHPQMLLLKVPKTRDEWMDSCGKETLKRSVKGCLQKKHPVPIYQSLNQDVRCSIPEESTEFCINCSYGQKQDCRFRQPCRQYSPCYQNGHGLGLLNAVQQRLKQLYFHETTEQKSTMNHEMTVNTNASSYPFYCDEKCTFQVEDEQTCLQLPDSVNLKLSKCPSAERTIELSSSHGGQVPIITMTCPTPVPH